MLWCRALVVALVLALVGTAIGDARGVVRDLIGLLSEAKTKEALKLLRGPSRQDLLEDPEQAREACAEAADYALDVSEEAADLEQAEELMDEFVKLGNELIAKHPESADAYRGVACSYLAHGRFKASLDEAEDEADWAKAAEHALQAGKLEHDAEHVVAASRYWRDAAIRLGSPPVVAHLDRASQIMKDAGKQFPGAGEVTVEETRIDLVRARVAIAGKDKRSAKALAQGVLKKVEPLVGKESKAQADAEAAWNKATSFLLAHKLDKKAAFRVRPVKSRYSYLQMDVPSGSHWKVRHSKSTSSLMTTLTRYDRPGVTRIRLYRYKWSTNYTGDHGEAGGDNAKGLCEMDRKSDVEWLEKVKKQKKSIKGRLNRKICKTSGYELFGYDEDGDLWWIRNWTFKGEEQRNTYQIRVSRWGQDPCCDPEIAQVLDSVVELPPKKK